MLCAVDGHARNFSIFIGRGGAYSLTPRYDVLSAYPILGLSRNRLAPEKAKMAMAAKAVKGRGKHYQWDRITRTHWLATAKANGLENEIEGILSELVDGTGPVLSKVQAAIPTGFPASVAEPILMGLKKAAKRLSVY